MDMEVGNRLLTVGLAVYHKSRTPFGAAFFPRQLFRP
jgi:hypothetical protein